MDVTKLQMQAYAYQLDHGKPPSSFADLKEYFADGKVPEKDPWGGAYVMQQTKDGTVRIRCANLAVKAGVPTKCWEQGSNGNR
ncbi:MAG: hypothetical protein NTV22_02135 [bacterium]|nr:hypothetical protein [bacterium]